MAEIKLSVKNRKRDSLSTTSTHSLSPSTRARTSTISSVISSTSEESPSPAHRPARPAPDPPRPIAQPPAQPMGDAEYSTPQSSPRNLKSPEFPSTPSLGNSEEPDEHDREMAASSSDPRQEGSNPDSDHANWKELKEKEKRGFFSTPRHRSTIFPYPQIFTASLREKNDEMHKIFTSLPDTERLIVDYSCALQRDILIHGRLYLTQNWICFYANIFSWETLLTIPFQSVKHITKEKTAFVFPNAIHIVTTAEKYGFSSLVSREITYNVIFMVWQNCLLDQPRNPLELVLAACKTSGNPIEVESEEALWGRTQLRRRGNGMPILATHIELGAVPEHGESMVMSSHSRMMAAEEQDEQTDASRSLPVSTAHSAYLSHVPVLTTRSYSAPNGNIPNTSPLEEGGVHPHPTALSAQRAERRSLDGDGVSVHSLGGASIYSSEFEAISFTEETGEYPCGCPNHDGRTLLNQVYNTDVETMFQLLFTDSDFMRLFFKARKTINVEMSEWQSQADCSRLRDVSYTLALNYSFGPKFARSSEHQIYSKTGVPGMKHIVNTEVVNHDIPYNDTFFVACRYCITRMAHNKTRLRVTANINFKRTCWGFLKNLIERNAGDGLRGHYNHLETFLKEYLESQPPQLPKKRVHSRNRRPKHRRQSSITQPLASTPLEVSAPINPAPTAQDRTSNSSSRLSLRSLIGGVLGPSQNEEQEGRNGGGGHSMPQVNFALTLLLGILILSNMLLYHYLMSYPSGPAHSPAPSPAPLEHAMLLNTPLEWPTSKDEWVSLMREQLEVQEKETERWRDTLQTMVNSLDKVEATLTSTKTALKSQLEHYSALCRVAKERHTGNPQGSTNAPSPRRPTAKQEL